MLRLHPFFPSSCYVPVERHQPHQSTCQNRSGSSSDPRGCLVHPSNCRAVLPRSVAVITWNLDRLPAAPCIREPHLSAARSPAPPTAAAGGLQRPHYHSRMTITCSNPWMDPNLVHTNVPSPSALHLARIHAHHPDFSTVPHSVIQPSSKMDN